MFRGDRAPAHVAAVIGTRPEAIKMAPVLRALARIDIACGLICTGQHPDLDLAGCGVSGVEPHWLGVDVSGIDADTMCARIEARLAIRLEDAPVDLVLVQGDTNSALAGGRAARNAGVAVGHVEAGLRTHDPADPWPEERNRVAIDAVADLLFAPTENAARNLRAENVAGGILVTGNSGIDALVEAAGALPASIAGEPPLILVTVHRRENRGAGVHAVGEALRRIAAAAHVNIVVALHPNLSAQQEMIAATLGIPRTILLAPQTYARMTGLIARSRLILTDSGGLQEEGPALGRPVLILRASTERPEAVAAGNAILVGTNPTRIAAETLRLLRHERAYARMSVPAFPFGEPGASARIAAAVAAFLGSPPPPQRLLQLDPPPARA